MESIKHILFRLSAFDPVSVSKMIISMVIVMVSWVIRVLILTLLACAMCFDKYHLCVFRWSHDWYYDRQDNFPIGYSLLASG